MFNDNYERIAGTFDASFYENMLRGKKNAKPTFDEINMNKPKKKKKLVKHPRRMNKSANSKCQCGSGKKYKKCCMKIKLKENREKIQHKIDSDRYHVSFSSSSGSDSDY